ncbi:hypothetical protein E4U15_005838 [Claviceps sp. LM218 group G6]|nr:hypothetical protein E4U15_005838 [Claviceps sp. LM218 group G6]
MDDRRELRKMPRGERCPECGSRKWYLQDGLRYCARGHQIELQGFIQFEVGGEEAMGRTGPVARRKKEVREVEKRQLIGQEGKSLYVEAVQLLLRKQLEFLVRKKGHRPELETVVRDLWDLRIRGYGASIHDYDISESEPETFSSQPVAADMQEKLSWKPASRVQSWDPARGNGWPLPRMPETIALCYLGCLLLKIPTRLADLQNWVSSGTMPYLRAYVELPIEMQKRMPSAYAKALKLPLAGGLKGHDLYQILLDTAFSYKVNYELTFPEMNWFPMLVQYAKELALPVEVVSITKRLVATFDYCFEFPALKARTTPFDHPEIKLLAFLVVSTKLCFPLNHGQSVSLASPSLLIPRFDWEKWKVGYTEQLEKLRRQISERPSFEELSPEKITNLEDGEFDAFVSYLRDTIGNNTKDPITNFFPVELDSPPQPSFPDVIESQVEKEAYRVLAEAVKADNNTAPGAKRYESFRAVQDLPETASVFFNAAGDAAGVSLDMLVRATYKLEQQLIWWQRNQPVIDSESIIYASVN